MTAPRRFAPTWSHSLWLLGRSPAFRDLAQAQLPSCLTPWGQHTINSMCRHARGSTEQPPRAGGESKGVDRPTGGQYCNAQVSASWLLGHETTTTGAFQQGPVHCSNGTGRTETGLQLEALQALEILGFGGLHSRVINWATRTLLETPKWKTGNSCTPQLTCPPMWPRCHASVLLLRLLARRLTEELDNRTGLAK